MYWLDGLVILILIYYVLHGLYKGFVQEICSLFGTITGILLAINYNSTVTNLINTKLNIPLNYSRAMSFPLIWLSTICVFSIIGKILHTITKTLFFAWLDYIAGAVFGAVKGLLIITLIFMSLLNPPFPAKVQDVIKQSRSYPYANRIISAYYKLMEKSYA